MKYTKLITLLLALLATTVSSHAQADFEGMYWKDIKLDYTRLEQSSHPRIFLTDAEFKVFKKQVCKGGHLGDLHNQMMIAANNALKDETPIEYTLDSSGKRLLKVSTDALTRIVSLSYAYRFTGRKDYLKKAEQHLNTVCDFPDWHPSHFLDPSEMSFGVAIGYDWLFNSLSQETKDKVVDRLASYAMEEAVHGQGQHIFRRTGNWNQVCIACMTAAAIATYESDPRLADEVIRRGLEGNIPEAKNIYYPDGAFPEGPGYWEYGTCYQEYLLLLYEGAFGTDFNISASEGFSNTAWFRAFTRSGAGHIFNYGDNSDRLCPSPGLWYLAYKFKCPDVLYDELSFFETDEYSKERRLILAIVSAAKLGKVKIEQPSDRVFFANGRNPIIILKAGWGKNDCYLGFKGGSAGQGHSHMDVGSFVFDAFGTRWVHDYYVRNYQVMEAIWQKLGLEKKQYAFTQDSYRWYLLDHSNLGHSTLTVNNHLHRVDGEGVIEEVIDGPDRLGARMDMSSVFVGDLSKAVRTAVICNNAYLEVKDELACKEAPSVVRWSIVVMQKPKIVNDGILLSDGITTMKLSTDAPGAEFKTWSSDPKDYGTPTAFGEEKFKKTWICGFEFTMPAGSEMNITTTLKKK